MQEGEIKTGRRWPWIAVFGGLALVVGIYVAHPVVLRRLAGYLVVDQPLEKADAILALSGDPPFRAMEAADLHRRGWAPNVILTRTLRGPEYYAFRKLGMRHPEEHEINREVLLRQGVLPKTIVILDNQTVNTWEELQAISRWLEAHGKHSVIIVTSKSHTRRVTLLWRHLKHGAIHAVVRSAPGDPFDPGRAWWRERRFAFLVLWEYLGLMNYLLGFPL